MLGLDCITIWLKSMSSLAQIVLERLKNSVTYPTTLEFLSSGGMEDYHHKFLSRCKEYGLTEHNVPIQWSTPIEESFLLLANLNIPKIYLTGNARGSKTLGCTLLLADLTLFTGARVLWAYPREMQVRDNVATNHKLLLPKYWAYFGAKGAEINITSPSVVQTPNGQRVIHFAHASSGEKGHTVVNAALTSKNADIVFADEFSQYPDPSVVTVRAEKSLFPKPIARLLGTPGSGMGIEGEISISPYVFYPSTICTGCNQVIFLNPYGTLITDFDDQYRPSKWRTDSEGKPEFQCPHCLHPISDAQRLSAHMRCTKTGVLAAEMEHVRPDRVAIHYSPLMNNVSYNLAQHIIQKAEGHKFSRDYIQQTLGLASVAGESQLTPDCIELTYRNPTPERTVRQSYFITAGVDVGAKLHITVCRWHLRATTPFEAFNKAHCEVIYTGEEDWASLPRVVAGYGVQMMHIDRKPEFTKCAELCAMFGGVVRASEQCVFTVEKLATGLSPVVHAKSYTFDGQPISRIHTYYFQDSLSMLFRQQRVSWSCTPPHDLIKHFGRVERVNDGWVHKGNDHWWFAFHFAIAALYEALFNPG